MLLAFVLVLGVAIGGTIAWLTAETPEAKNTFTVGNITIDLKEYDRNLAKFLTHVDGTSIDMLKSRKVPANNTTGVKGVYLIRGKYVAKIVFQKKQYILGAFESLEEAAEARKEVEEQINSSVLAHFEKWNARAARDPQWAHDNPVRFEADRDQQGRLRIRCYPVLEDIPAPAERKIYRTRTAVAAAEHPEL